MMRFKWFLWCFCHFKVPLIGYLKPGILLLNDEILVIKLPLTRRSKNHLHSMYFGALAVGADLAGGLYAFYYSRRLNISTALVFKSFHAEFLRRPESDVYFTCTMGNKVKDMLLECQNTKQRISQLIEINAYTHYMTDSREHVARFQLELSLNQAQ